MLVGDQSQQLYAFRGADSVRIFELMNDVDTTTYNLNRNYRNGSKIIQFAERIIAKNGKQYETHSICMRQTPGRIVERQWTVSELVNALNVAFELGIDTSNIINCFLQAENPIALLKGNKLLSDYGLRNGTVINFTE